MPAKDLSFPLRADTPLAEWADMFPARHGRVSFGEFSRPSEQPRFSVSMARFMSSIHYEFAEFHNRLSQPLAEDAGVTELIEYAFSLVERMETAKPFLEQSEEELSAVSQASMLTELIQFCFVENEALCAGRFPRWLLRHCHIPIEEMVMEANSIVESEGALFKTDEPRFWAIVKQLALLDLSPVVAKLLRRYSEYHMRQLQKSSPLRYSIELLASFFEEVPSLFDIATAARSQEEAVSALEKRRQFASVALFKLNKDMTGPAGDVIRFLWQLQVNREEDYDDLIADITSMQFTEDDPWYLGVMLSWTWLHSIDAPDAELVRTLGKHVLDQGKSMTEASVIDAAIYALLSGDLVALFSLLVEERAMLCGPWLPAILGDLCFYAGVIPSEIRDTLLLAYCHWLEASGSIAPALGRRMAADVVLTLSEKASSRAGPEILGRLARGAISANSTKQWLSVVKLCPMDQPWAESICMEKYQSDLANGRVVDAIHSLSLAAEVGADVHIGACRISDFIDGHGDMVKEAFVCADEAGCGSVTSSLLPEYVESGRLEFYRRLAQGAEDVDKLVVLATSPNCPPERVVELIAEIRNGVAKGQKLKPDQIFGLTKILSGLDTWIQCETDVSGQIDVLLGWLATQYTSSCLAI